MIRTVLIDDHRVVTEGLRRLLSETGSFEVVATFSDGQTFLSSLHELSPALIIIDIEMAGLDGLEVIRRVRSRQSEAIIVVMSMHEEEGFIAAARKAGANGCFPKSKDPGQLASWLLELISHPEAMPMKVLREKSPLLSRQEQLILRYVADGKTSQEIADALFISPLTVKTHRQNLFRKLNASNSAALVRIALDQGLI
ncbi:MAG: response regulator transcription factor [Cyclobacteriaceae bacterium]|nr:response regulator transcription factor [Cyclobacteriaceae bacterium]